MNEATASATPPEPPGPRRLVRVRPVARPRARAKAVSAKRPAPSLVERLAGFWLLVLCAVFALALYAAGWSAALVFGLFAHPPRPPPERVEVAVVERPKPPPPPPAPPKPEQPKPKPKLVHRAPPPKLPPPPKEAPPPPPKTPPAPPPPTVEAKKPTPAPIPLVGISFSSTSTSGSFAMNVGNTAMGQVAPVAPKPEEVKPYKAPKYVPVYDLPQAPVFLNNVTNDEMAKFYPPDAKAAEVEDDVQVKLLVDGDGSVAKITVVGWSHHEFAFDKAARQVARLYRFQPAKVGGEPVATEIDFTIHWELPY